jgi:hypothetical protein
MRGLAWFVLAFVAISFAPAARAAALLNSCPTLCTTNSSGILLVDYTVPSDGQTYRWDLWSDPGHPAALITLDAPNDTSATAKISNGNGTTHTDLFYPPPNFTWNEVVNPGHTVITVSGPANFDFCASNPSAGVACAVDNQIFGDSSFLRVTNIDGPATITFASSPIAVPEPAAWSLMIGGFLALGWALRRRRSAAGQPA